MYPSEDEFVLTLTLRLPKRDKEPGFEFDCKLDDETFKRLKANSIKGFYD
jgi:hypothetical protein